MNAPELCPHAKAREILGRFNASHWNNDTEHARYSIPARPDYDDDLQLSAYIDQCERELTRIRAAIQSIREDAEFNHAGRIVRLCDEALKSK